MRFSNLLLLVAFFLCGCDLIDAVKATKSVPDKLDSTQTKIDDTNNTIEETNEYIRKQKMLLGLDDMFKARNTAYIFPPTGMMAGGKAFAETATTEELASLTYLWLVELGKGTSTEEYVADVQDWDFKADKADKKSSVRDRWVKWTALEVIAGLTPQKKVEELIQRQVMEGGRYRDDVYVFLYARAKFTYMFMLRESLLAFDEKLDTVGKLREVIERIERLEYLTKLPFADKIAVNVKSSVDSFKQSGSLEELDEEENGLEMTRPMWQKVLSRLEAMGEKFSASAEFRELRNKVEGKVAL